MVRYRRNLQPGGTYFLTITLHDRRSRILVDFIDRLRTAIAREKSRHSFRIDAIVVLPDHWHTIVTLPEGDSDYAGRMRRIKAGFTRRTRSRYSGSEAADENVLEFIVFRLARTIGLSPVTHVPELRTTKRSRPTSSIISSPQTSPIS